MRLMKTVLIILLAALPASATTYYVSSSTGSDSNTSAQAQSKSTPWAHAPGMPNATGNAASYSIATGDVFTFKGCDIWFNASFPAILSATNEFWGVDKTWFNTSNCSSNWNRPIFSACTSALPGAGQCTNQLSGAGCVSSGNIFLKFNGTNTTVDNIELRDLYWTTDAGGTCFGSVAVAQANNIAKATLSNIYFHHWGHSSGAKDGDAFLFFTGGTACAQCTVDFNVWDNADNTSGSGTYSGGSAQWPNVLHSVLSHMPNEIKPFYAGEIGYNLITHAGLSFDTSIHINCIETVGDQGTGIYYIHDNNIVKEDTNCESLQIGNSGGGPGGHGEVDYVWNNVWDGTSNPPQLPQSSPTGSLYMWNNVNAGQSGCLQNAGHGYSFNGDFMVINNYCPNSSGNGVGSPTVSGTKTVSNNLGPTIAAAAAQGYVNSGTYIFSPQNGSGSTVGTGLNLTSMWPAGFNTNDTSYAVTEQTINGVVQAVFPARVANVRPSSGAWDVGAYEFGGTAPAIGLSPSSILFAGTPIGTNSSSPVTLTNTGTANLTISAVSVSGSATFTETDNCVGTITPASTCTINVKFSPVALGLVSGTLSITGNASTTALISGTGTNVAPGIPVIIGSLPSGTVGKVYSGSLSASGGSPPYTWSVAPNPPIPGLTLAASTGVLSGTPTITNVTDLIFTVIDSSHVISNPYPASITINSASVTPLKYVLTPNKTSLTFTGTSGGSNPTMQSVSVSDSTPCPPPSPAPVCHWPVTVATDSSWLSASISGTTSFNTGISVNLSGLAAGTYKGNVILTVAPQNGYTLGNSPMKIPVTLTLTGPPPPKPTLTVNCVGLVCTLIPANIPSGTSYSGSVTSDGVTAPISGSIP